MVMQAPPLAAAIREARQASGGRVIGLSPQGSPLSQATVERLAGEPALVLLAGSDEGIDQRLLGSEDEEELADAEVQKVFDEIAAPIMQSLVAAPTDKPSIATKVDAPAEKAADTSQEEALSARLAEL